MTTLHTFKMTLTLILFPAIGDQDKYLYLNIWAHLPLVAFASYMTCIITNFEFTFLKHFHCQRRIWLKPKKLPNPELSDEVNGVTTQMKAFHVYNLAAVLTNVVQQSSFLCVI